jgi:glucose-6-phosphate dehydrogenase assembly protein OpcA
MTASQGLWSEQDTTPARIEAALRELLKQRHSENQGYVPARVLNLVVVLDKEWRGEIENRLAQVGRNHPSRTVVVAVEPGRTTLDAWATTTAEGEAKPGSFCVAHEHVVVEVGPEHLKGLDTIVDPLVITDLATVVWAPHGHRDAVDALRRLTQVVLRDSVDDQDPHDAIDRAAELSEWAYVVDLAWLRSTPWRERIAATFDPPQWRGELAKISSVKVHHRTDSEVAGMLLLGWLSTRLGWSPDKLIMGGGTQRTRARCSRGEVELVLEPDERLNVPGLAGITIETQSGVVLTLERGPGGLAATRRDHKGRESKWTIMGASRGEAGILGEGIRQALLREPTYRPALEAAGAMLA